MKNTYESTKQKKHQATIGYMNLGLQNSHSSTIDCLSKRINGKTALIQKDPPKENLSKQLQTNNILIYDRGRSRLYK